MKKKSLNICKTRRRIKLENKYTFFLLLIVGGIIGYIFASITDWSYFIIDKEISIADILSIVVDICLVIWITRVLEKKHQIQVADKGLIHKLINELETLLSSLLDFMEESDVKHSLVTYRLQIIAQHRDLLQEAMVSVTFAEGNVECKELIKKQKQNIKELRRAMTYTPAQHEDKNEYPVVKLGRILFNENIKGNITNIIYDIKKDLLLMQVELNKI